MKRSRWAAIGAAVAVTVGSGGLMSASADVSSGDKPVFVSITPCRIVDTRPAPDNVGARATPLGAAETYPFTVRGTNGNCTIPSDAIGVAVNLAAVFPTAPSFFTLFPSDAPRPLAANLNFVGGQAPVSNSASIKLSADGRMSIFNLSGTVHFTLDITGYYVGHNHNDLYYTKTETDTMLAAKANNPVTSAQILDGTVGTVDLADAAVTTAKIADGAVTTAKILDATIGLADLAPNSVNSSKIVDESIVSADVAEFSLSNQDISVFYAVVAANGTLDRSSGPNGPLPLGAVTSTRTSQGRYSVTFGRDISACAFQGTIATTGNSGTAGPAQIELAGLAGDVNGIFVRILDSAGALAGVDTSFHLVVVC